MKSDSTLSQFSKHGNLTVRQICSEEPLLRREKFRNYLTSIICDHLSSRNILNSVSASGAFTLSVPTAEADWYAEVMTFDPQNFAVRNINNLMSHSEDAIVKDSGWKLLIKDPKQFKYWIGLIDCHIATIISDRDEVEKLFVTGIVQYLPEVF